MTFAFSVSVITTLSVVDSVNSTLVLCLVLRWVEVCIGPGLTTLGCYLCCCLNLVDEYEPRRFTAVLAMIAHAVTVVVVFLLALAMQNPGAVALRYRVDRIMLEITARVISLFALVTAIIVLLLLCSCQ